MTGGTCSVAGCDESRYVPPGGAAKSRCKAHYAAAARARRAAKRASAVACRNCGATFDRPTGRRVFCSRRCCYDFFNRKTAEHRAMMAQGIVCAGCGVTFDASRKRRFHDDACAKRTARQADRARRRARGGDRVRLRDICRRDNWRCGLCRRLIHSHLTYPHPGSASLDHIVPLSHGGKHEYRNVQAAHLRCNVAKLAGVWGQGEQLRLIA
jgi:5-methylcytosine-specific restriction endonuclease McrA